MPTIWFTVVDIPNAPTDKVSLKDTADIDDLKTAIKAKMPNTLASYSTARLQLKIRKRNEQDNQAQDLTDPEQAITDILQLFGDRCRVLVFLLPIIRRFKELSLSTSASPISGSIVNHPNYLQLNDFDFLDILAEEEKFAMDEIYRGVNDPNPFWECEVSDVQPWVQSLYQKIADYFGLIVNHDMRSDDETGGNYANHYLTSPIFSFSCDNTVRRIDYSKCYGFEDKLKALTDKNEALIQCHRYSVFFFEEPTNREHKYISIITDGFCYMLWYAYHDRVRGMMGGLTNAVYWDSNRNNDTVEILGRVFKTFKNTNIGNLSAHTSPRDFKNLFPGKDISNLNPSNLIPNSIPLQYLDQRSMDDALYSVVLKGAKRSLQTGLPVVKTSIGDIEACRVLGYGSNVIVFEARTTGHERVALKYSINDDLLKHEAQMLKKLEGLDDIPKLLYEEFGSMIPYIVTSMVGQKMTKIDIPTACNVIADIIKILKSLHECGYIHNDIHPGNIINLYGKFRLIDFDNAIQRSDKRDPIPIDWPAGNSTFASHNRGKYLGAGDDLEALCYTVAFIYDQDKMYWHTAIHDPPEAIHQKEEKLFHLFDGLPQIFRDFFGYVYDLDVTATPDYEYWQQQFQQTAHDSHFLLKTRMSNTTSS